MNASLGTWFAILIAVTALVGAQEPRAGAPPSPAPLEQDKLIRLLAEGEASSLVQAAESIQQAAPKTDEGRAAVADAVKSALSTTRDAKAEAALRLALGKLAAAGEADAAEWGFESMSVTHRPSTPPEVFAAHVAALEMVPGAAKELMLGNLDVALNFPEVEPKERQRLKEFVTLTAEGMRTRELAVFLDALLRGEEDLLAKIEAPLEARLIRCYKNVKADPPVHADAVLEWVDKNPGGPPEVEVAALETIYHVGTTRGEAASKLAERLLADPDATLLLSKRLSDGHLSRKLLPAVKSALLRHQQKSPRAELQSAIQRVAEFERR